MHDLYPYPAPAKLHIESSALSASTCCLSILALTHTNLALAKIINASGHLIVQFNKHVSVLILLDLSAVLAANYTFFTKIQFSWLL